MKWTIFIPGHVTPSNNDLLGHHWSYLQRLKRDWEWTLKAFEHMSLRARIPKAEGKRTVTVTNYRKRRFDKDNNYGGCKVLWDPMKRLGWIKDDNEIWLEQESRQETLKNAPWGKKEGLVIVIEESDPEASVEVPA